jgi:iron(III) transport system substrate-binding protein
MSHIFAGAARRAFLSAILAASVSPALAAETVNVYTYRQPELVKPLLDAFTEETGITTRVLFADKGLEERIKAEGANSPADVILTVDISRLHAAEDAGVTQTLDNQTVNANIPAQYRDPHGHWFGVTTRARVVYASKDRVEQDSITYEELADPKWRGRICVRSGQHDYNLGLIASLIAHHGEEWTEEWLRGVKDNLARKPAGGDRDQAQAIFAGECDIALGNTYYVGVMQTNEKEPEQQEWADAIKVIFPDVEERGSHVNISGMALAKNSPNRENAIKLMEFLAGDEAQRIYAEANHEYPVKEGVPVSDVVASFGKLKADTLPLAEIAHNRKKASELVDKVAFDEGPSA